MSVKNKNEIGKILQKNIKCENALSKMPLKKFINLKCQMPNLKAQNIKCFKPKNF
jgi:hypothetical protein